VRDEGGNVLIYSEAHMDNAFSLTDPVVAAIAIGLEVAPAKVFQQPFGDRFTA
jgi:hypothetical protein